MSKNILVIEDDMDAAMLLEITMKEPIDGKTPYLVERKDDGRQALNDINLKIERGEKIDLILLDHLLPGLYGIDIARALWQNEKTKGIPIIMVSALPLNEIKKEKEKLGNIKEHFRKPANLELIRKKVEEILTNQ